MTWSDLKPSSPVGPGPRTCRNGGGDAPGALLTSRRRSRIGWGLTGVAALLGWAPIAHAQTQPQGSAAPARPAITIERYNEDWTVLADPQRRTGRWTEPFKYIPLDDAGDVALTTGVEARLRYESYEDGQWGAQPRNDYLWSRLMPYADLRVGRFRAFVQPIVSDISGADRVETPVDTTGADLLQGFVGLDLEVAPDTMVALAAGRRLRSLGAGRLVDTRYGVNVPLAFDGGDVTVTRGSRRITALGLRPVDNRTGDFDDRGSDQKALWGLYGTQWLAQDRQTGIDLYWLGFRDRNAVYDQGAGRQVVHSFGARWFGAASGWRWNLEGVVQRGDFDGARTAAWGVGGEFRRRFADAPLSPELVMMIDYISGDDDPDDPELNTFNALFPRGRYFVAQSPIGPRNLIHLQPSVTVRPRTDLDVTLMGAAYWRESTRDGVYSIPGMLIRSGRGSDARYIGTQVELSATWRATQELELAVSPGALDAGPFIRETGPSDTILLASLMATFKY